MPTTTRLALPYPTVDDEPAGATQMQALAEKLDTEARPVLVTSLPGSPTDGQEVYYVADSAAGVTWHLRYRAAAPGASKWEFVGGSPLMAEVEAELANATSPGSYVLLDAGAPSVTVPLAGDYLVTVGSRIGNSAAGNTMFHAVQFGAAAPVDADSIQSTSAVVQARASHSREFRKAIAAGAVLRSQYKVGGGTGVWAQRFLGARPVRLG